MVWEKYQNYLFGLCFPTLCITFAFHAPSPLFSADFLTSFVLSGMHVPSQFSFVPTLCILNQAKKETTLSNEDVIIALSV